MCVCVYVFPPFHMGTVTWVRSGFDPVLTQVLDPAAEQGFDLGSRPGYVITVF